jgi:BrxA
MIEETRRLLQHWRSGDPLDDFTRRVQQEGLLGNSTAYRTRDAVTRVFAPRFLRPTDKPARILQKVLSSGLPGRTFTELLFVFTARQDPLVRDFTVREYWPSVRRGRSVMDTDSMVSFLSEAHHDGRLDNRWSETVSIRIARCVLSLLRDVGLLRESVRGRREIVNYRMSDEGAALLARELHESGVTDSSLCNHPDWELFGMTPSEVVETLDGLGEHRGVIVQRAGSVVHFTWVVKSIEELINVLAR